MKFKLWFYFLLISYTSSLAQLTGYLVDQHDQPIPDCKISNPLFSGYSISNAEGKFYFIKNDTGRTTLRFQKFNLDTVLTLDKSTSNPPKIKIPFVTTLQESIIQSESWGTQKNPNTVSLKKEQLDILETGRDIPYLLDRLSSCFSSSDGGNGIGYTNIRIRGIEPYHIQYSLNGVPINDSESSLAYIVNMPDIAHQADQILIQKGAIPSRAGAGGFGAAIDLLTGGIKNQKKWIIRSQIGSFHSLKNSLQFQSGLLNKSNAFDIAISHQKSSGYVDRASSNLSSFSINYNYIKPKWSSKFTIFGGKEITGQAWFGIPQGYITNDSLRRTNIAGTEKSGNPFFDKDDYLQLHFQCHQMFVLTPSLELNYTGNYTRGKGFFENFKANEVLENYSIKSGTTSTADIVRQKWLDNHFVFNTIKLIKYFTNQDLLNIGLSASTYLGKHYGIANPYSTFDFKKIAAQYYFSNSSKNELAAFFKYNKRIHHWELGTDWSTKYIQYRAKGTHDKYNNIDINRQFGLFNGRLYFNHKTNTNWQQSLQLFYIQREPFRDDLLSNTQVGIEKLISTEIGSIFNSKFYQINLNFYAMLYQNYFAFSGEVNQVGEPIRINIPNAYRIGIESSVFFHWNSSNLSNLQINISRNRSNEFLYKTLVYNENFELIQVQENRLKHSRLSLSPELISSFGHQIKIKKLKNLFIDYHHKWVGKMILDNSNDELKSLPAFQYGDIKIGKPFSIGPHNSEIWVSVNNLWNRRYASNGWAYSYATNFSSDSMDPYVKSVDNGKLHHGVGVFPQATINVMLGFKIQFL